MKNNNEGHFVSKIGNKKEERLELFNKKIKETFERSEDFFKNFRFKEETFKKKMFEGNLSMNEVYKTGELLDITSEELIFIFFGETPEEQRKYLITEAMMKGQSKEVIEFLQLTNKILKGKSNEERKIFLNALHKTIEKDLKGSEEKWWREYQESSLKISFRFYGFPLQLFRY